MALILHDHEAEVALIGAALIDPKVTVSVGHLPPEALHDPTHALIWRAMLDLSGGAFDAVQIKARIRELGGADRAFEQLRAAEEQALSAAHAAHYADTIRDRAQRRALVAAAERIAEAARTAEMSSAEAVGEAEAALLASVTGTATAEPLPIAHGLRDYIRDLQAGKDRGGMVGLPTGIQGIDRVTKGLREGQVVVIAARPGLGKSTLADQIAEHVAELPGKRVLALNLEMRSSEIAGRQVNRRLRWTEAEAAENIRTSHGQGRFTAEAAHIHNLRLDIDDRAEVTIAEIRATARRHKLKHPDLALVVIDYLQLVSGGLKRTESREREIAHISRSVKILAKELGLPVLLLSQLSRAADKEQRKPRLSDLRESGSIEQDADIVIFIHHDGETAAGAVGAGVEAELIVAKNRRGPTGSIAAWFRREWSVFEPRDFREGEQHDEHPRPAGAGTRRATARRGNPYAARAAAGDE